MPFDKVVTEYRAPFSEDKLSGFGIDERGLRAYRPRSHWTVSIAVLLLRNMPGEMNQQVAPRA
jgi:hypothetical protein